MEKSNKEMFVEFVSRVKNADDIFAGLVELSSANLWGLKQMINSIIFKRMIDYPEGLVREKECVKKN